MVILEKFSAYIIPFVLLVVALIVMLGKGDYFSAFLDGAKSGALSCLKLLPTMCALVIGVSMFTASGAAEFISDLIAPVLNFLGVPSDILTLIITRPISGSASIATFVEILQSAGPDSFSALCASVILASSDTVIYVICVYFSSCGIKKTRYALGACLFVSVFCVFLSCIVCKLFF